MGLPSMLYKLAGASGTGRAARRGPGALGKRYVRKAVGRSVAHTGIFKWPR